MTNKERLELNNLKIEQITKKLKSKVIDNSRGEYFVKVIDYDGTMLAEANLNIGDTFELPTPPSHKGLVFQEWSCTQEIVDNKITITDNNVMIGAVYTTASGLSEFDIELTKKTGLAVTFKMSGTKDWGDGTSDTTQSHTYSDYGKYTIKCDGTSMSTGSTSGLFGQSSSSANHYCVGARLTNITQIKSGALQYCYTLTSLTISNSVTVINPFAFNGARLLANITIPYGVKSIESAFKGCCDLKTIIIPNGVTTISDSAFSDCYLLTYIAIPNSVTKIGVSAFQYCYSLKHTLVLNSVTSLGSNGGVVFIYCRLIPKVILQGNIDKIGASAFKYCSALENITIPNSVTSIGDSAFYDCGSLTNITIPNGVTNIDIYAFKACYSLTNITIPNGVTNIGIGAFGSCYSLTKVAIPNSVTSIQSMLFEKCYSIMTYDFSTHTTVPTLANTNAFTGINGLAKIIVPDALYDEWIVATNWATYADYIYKASEVL